MQAAGWGIEQIPSPKVHGQDYYVSNPDGVLSEETVQQINELCVRLNANTGAELAVVAVKQFDDTHYGPHSFSLRLFNHWGVGSAETNTGVLLFLSRDSRDIQIITGDGIADQLTDGRSGHILDKNLKYLSKNDYDKGMLHICMDIEKELMKDENRAKLLLGWKPEEAKVNYSTIAYFAAGFILMLLLAWWGYKKMQGKPGQKKKDRQEEAWPPQLVTGILMFFFPIPLVPFYIFYRIQCKRLEDIPPVCPKCGNTKILLSKEEGAQYLTKPQLNDEKVDSFQHEVWKCSGCGEIEIITIHGRNHFKYDLCPKCGSHAMNTTKREVISKATYHKNGEQKNTRECLCCGYKDFKTLHLKKEYVEIREDRDADEFWGSSRSSSSSSSWSSSSGGSWGGGRSSGGGAGRKF
jgi:uncharacterized protein